MESFIVKVVADGDLSESKVKKESIELKRLIHSASIHLKRITLRVNVAAKVLFILFLSVHH